MQIGWGLVVLSLLGDLACLKGKSRGYLPENEP